MVLDARPIHLAQALANLLNNAANGTVAAFSDGPSLGSTFIVRLPLVVDSTLPGGDALPARSSGAHDFGD